MKIRWLSDNQVKQIKMKIRCWLVSPQVQVRGASEASQAAARLTMDQPTHCTVQYALCHTCNWNTLLHHPGTAQRWPPAAFPQCTPRHIILRHHVELTALLTSAHSLFNSLPINVGFYSVPGGWCLLLNFSEGTSYNASHSSVNVVDQFCLFLHNTNTICPETCVEKLHTERVSAMHKPLYSW